MKEMERESEFINMLQNFEISKKKKEKRYFRFREFKIFHKSITVNDSTTLWNDLI